MFGKPVGIDHGLPGEYLLDALFEVGPSEWQAGNEGPISWQTLAAYVYATEFVSEPWECRALMAMSRAYFRAKVEGKDVHCIAPIEREENDELCRA